jgi:hypothetical protein
LGTGCDLMNEYFEVVSNDPLFDLLVESEEANKAFKENEIYDRFEYDENITKEAITNVLDKCVELFFNNTIFPVIDINGEKVKDEPST